MRRTYPEAYAAGGPGCVKCRGSAAEAAVVAVQRVCESFGTSPTVDALHLMSVGCDVLTDEDLAIIGRGLWLASKDVCDIVSAEFFPPPRKRRGDRYAHDRATVEELGRESGIWFPQSLCAVDTSNIVYTSNRRTIYGDVVNDRPFSNNPALIAIAPGSAVAAQHLPHQRGWGDDPMPDDWRLVSGEVLSRLEPGTGRYGYQHWATLAKTLDDLAKELAAQ